MHIWREGTCMTNSIIPKYKKNINRKVTHKRDEEEDETKGEVKQWAHGGAVT